MTVVAAGDIVGEYRECKFGRDGTKNGVVDDCDGKVASMPACNVGCNVA